MKLYVDMDSVETSFDAVLEWDRKYREVCGFNNRDLDMIALGLNQARGVLCRMCYEDLSKGE